MIQLKKLIISALIVLSTYSISWCQSNNDSIVNNEPDSVIVAVSALRVANAKMIELKYEKEINKNLKEIIINDSCIIAALDNNIICCERNANMAISKARRQRNRAIEVGGGTSLLLLVLLIIAL